MTENLDPVSSKSGLAKTLSLRTNFSWTAIGNVILAACQWGIIATLAKIGDAEMVGIFALGLAITAPIQMFFQMQLRGVQATDARRDFDFPAYLNLRILTTVAALLMSCIVIGIAGYKETTAIVVAVIALAKAFDSLADVYFGAFQLRERMDINAKAVMLKGILSFALTVTGVWVTGNLVVGVVGYATASLIPLVSFVIPSARNLVGNEESVPRRHNWRFSQVLRLLRMASPLGFVMLLVSLNSNIPRYAIEQYSGTHELGIYAAVSYLIIAGTTIVSALGQAASPRLAKYFASGAYSEFQSLLIKLVIGGASLGVAGAVLARLVGREILTLLYTPEYAEYGNLLIILSLVAGVTFSSSFAGYAVTATRKFAVQVPTNIIVTLVTLLGSYSLVPSRGLEGAAIAMGIGMITKLFLSGSVLVVALFRERYKVEYNQ